MHLHQHCNYINQLLGSYLIEVDASFHSIHVHFHRECATHIFLALELDHGDFAQLIEIVREVAARPSPKVIETQKESNADMAKQFLPQFESRYAEFAATKGVHITAYDFDEYDYLYPPRPD